MRSLADPELLDVWERSSGERGVGRAVALLEAATGERRDELARLPIGELDARLLALRAATLGERLEGCADCPACGERLEFELSVRDLAPAAGLGGGDDARPAVREVHAAGHTVRVRALTAADLAAAGGARDAEAARRLLIERAVVGARREGRVVSAADLPPAVLEELSQALAELDPGADAVLSLACPACGHALRVPFDAVAFVLSEVAVRARALMAEVDLLARAYGWSEPEVLAVPPARRSVYLEMAAR